MHQIWLTAYTKNSSGIALLLGSLTKYAWMNLAFDSHKNLVDSKMKL